MSTLLRAGGRLRSSWPPRCLCTPPTRKSKAAFSKPTSGIRRRAPPFTRKQRSRRCSRSCPSSTIWSCSTRRRRRRTSTRSFPISARAGPGTRQDHADVPARAGREVARRQAVHGEGRQMHVRSRVRARTVRGLPQEPAQDLVSQRQGDHDQRRPRGQLRAERAAAELHRAASVGLYADLSLPRRAKADAHQPDRDRAVQVRRDQAE